MLILIIIVLIVVVYRFSPIFFRLKKHVHHKPNHPLNRQFNHPFKKHNRSHLPLSVVHACETLQITVEQLTPQTIHQAYRAQIKHIHPDRHPHASTYLQQSLMHKTQLLNQSRDILLDFIKH